MLLPRWSGDISNIDLFFEQQNVRIIAGVKKWRKSMKLFGLLILLSLLSTSVTANEKCHSFFFFLYVVNDMAAKALSAHNRLFDSVLNVKSTNYKYQFMHHQTEKCEFKFKFWSDFAFVFKDTPECIFYFRVQEVVVYYDALQGIPTKSRILEYKVEHNFEDVQCK